MNSIYSLATRIRPTSIEKKPFQTVSPARVFSSMNARSCEQRPQTCHENNHAINNSTNNSTYVAPSYLRLRYGEGLAQYKMQHVVANESLFRNWLALIDNNDRWFDADKKDVSAKLIAQRAFRQGLSQGIQKIFSQSNPQSNAAPLNSEECEILLNVIQRHYLLKGNFDFHSIFIDMKDNHQQLLKHLMQFFVKNLTKNATHSLVEMSTQQDELKEQAATRARDLVARFHSVLNEHHDSGRLDKIQQQMEAEFLKAFNYEVVNEKDLQTNKYKNDEFFVVNKDGGYSIVTIDNFFEPLYEPVDADIYRRDKIENPNRDKPCAYFKTHFGEQILTYSGREDNWEKSEDKDFAQNTWKQALENEKQTEKNPETKARLNLDEIKRRDGLFSQKDAIESAASLLLHPLEQFNAASEYLGFNSRPHIPRKSQDYASPHHDEKSQFTYSKEWMPSSPQAIENMPSSSLFSLSDPLTFLVAEAASAVPTENAPTETTLAESQTQKEYDDWYEKGIAKSLNRQKRAFETGKITLDQIIKVSFEQYIGISSDPAFQNLRSILNKDLSHYQSHHADPNAERFKEIKATVAEIVENHTHGKKMLKFLSNTLGALQMAAIENNEDFRRSYMFYMHENEKNAWTEGTFFYHEDVEKLFPPSYQASSGGTAYFQHIKANRAIKNKQINIYALLLHQQTLSLAPNYKSLAMAFAHIDIINYSRGARTFIELDQKLYNSWAQIAQNTGVIKNKFPALQKHFTDRGLLYPVDLMTPIATSQHFNLGRFITSNTQSIGGVCHYLTMTVMLALSSRKIDKVANVKEMLFDFHKLSASDPIIYFRVINLLASANCELFDVFNTLPGSFRPIRPYSLLKKVQDNSKLADTVLSNDKHGFNFVVINGEASHSIGVMPIKVGNEVIHYFFDPNVGMIPCFCKEQFEEAIKITYEGVGVKNVNDPNEIKNVEIHAVKLNRRNLSFFRRLKTNSGFRFNQLDKQTLSRFANSHALSNEDWSAFFSGFNKGEKLYNKDFDSLEGDPVYKALKTDTSLAELAHLYKHALTNLPKNPINPRALSTATIGDVLERERLYATDRTDQDTYRNAARALESETWSNRGTLGSSSSQDTISDRTRFSVSLESLPAGSASGHESTQDLGQRILSSTQANPVPPQRPGIRGFGSRVRNVFIDCFGRLGRDRDALEAEFHALTNRGINPPTVRSFLDEISQENISEEDLDAIDLETHKINQQVNQINTKVAKILETSGLEASDFRFSPAENIGTADTILLHQLNNPTEKLSIDLSKHSKLANLWKEVKTVINSRTHNFAQTMTSHLPNAQRMNFLRNSWKAVGRVSDTGSKFLSLYALTTLGDESRFFQQSHLGDGEKVLNILSMADLVLDNGSNAAGFANSVVKRFFTPSPTLSKISRFSGKASNAVSLIVQGFELGFYSYAFKHAQTKMEREVAKLMVVSKSFQTALSVVSIAACTAVPAMAPIFMMLGFFISYIENVALTKTISKETANALFQQFAGELEFMRKLLENPELLFNEEEKQITVVSAAMPYSKLVVTENGIQMERKAKPFAVEFTETFRQTVEQYKGIIFRERGTHAGDYAPFSYDYVPEEYQGYIEMLQSFGGSFTKGFSLSPEKDYVDEFTGRQERGRQKFINQESTNKNGTFSEEVAQRKVVVSNLAQCLTQEDEAAAPTYQHAFTNREAGKAQNIVIPGHPIKPTYQSKGCNQAEVNGYSYAPSWDEINKLDKCDTAPDGSTKAGDFWKIRKVKDIYRGTEQNALPSLYKGKLAFKETSRMPHLRPESIINVNQWKLETSWKKHTCYESPDGLRVEVNSPQYVLSSGGAAPYIYHFPQDEFVENLKHLHLGNDGSNAQVAGYQAYGLHSGFPISNSNVNEKSSWFDIVLVPDGNTFLQLYTNTYLNISEQEITEAAPAKGNIHLMIPYNTLRLNGTSLGQKAIIGKKITVSPEATTSLNTTANSKTTTSLSTTTSSPEAAISLNTTASSKTVSKTELIFLPGTNQAIHIKLDDSVKRAVNVDILKELPNKSTAVCVVMVSHDEKDGLSLELNQISQVPLGNIMSTTALVNSQIQELKATFPDLVAKNVRVHNLDLSQTPYHQEKILDTASLRLAPIWEKTLNQTLVDTGSTNKTEFISTGWYFAQNENIKDHPAVQKSASLMVPKIWRNDLPSEVQEIVQRMVFVGFAREAMVAVPADVKSAIAHQDECFSYHFFDPQTELMIKQWGASEIRFWDSRDITQCSPGKIPGKVFWSGSETENYSCDVVHISPPTETMGGTQGRVAVMVEGNSSKFEFANSKSVTNQKFLNYLFDKSLSALIQRAQADPDWNPDESDLDLQNLMIHVKDIELKYKDNTTAPVQAFLLQDKESKLALVPEGEGLLGIPQMQNYAITAARVETSKNDTKPTYKLFKRQLIEGEAYEKINEQLTNGTLTIDEVDLVEKSEIKPEFQFVGIKNAPLENAVICHTAEGIAMAVNYDLENTKLLGINNDYLVNKNISLTEDMALLGEYQSLVNKVGPSAFAYLNLYQSDENNPEQCSIYVNTKTAIPTLIHVPVFYYEASQGNQTITKLALSKEILVLSDTNDVANQTKIAVVQDVSAKKIYTVSHLDNANPSLGDIFPYTYVWQSANSAFIGLDQHTYTPSSDVKLPKMNVDRLSLLPCDKQEQKRVVLSDWMLTRLNTLTLAKPIHTDDYVQQIQLAPTQLTAEKSIKPLITKDVLGRLQLSLFISTQNQDVAEGSKLIRINLENAVTADGKLDPVFVNSVNIHNATLNLQQLTNEAYVEYSKIIA